MEDRSLRAWIEYEKTDDTFFLVMRQSDRGMTTHYPINEELWEDLKALVMFESVCIKEFQNHKEKYIANKKHRDF